MSHFTKIDRANIISIPAFIAACEHLGFQGIRQNCMIKDYYGKEMRVDVAIKHGKYDIGLIRNAQGNYDMISDWWGLRQVGLPPSMKNCLTDEDIQNMLLKHTSAMTIIQQKRKEGFKANVWEDDEQNLHVELQRA